MVAAEFRASAFVANGTAFVGVSLDGKLQVWETVSGKLRKIGDQVNKFAVSVIDGAAGMHKVVCGTDSGSVFCVDIQNGDVVQLKEKHTGRVSAVKIHPCGDKAYSVGLDKVIVEWDLKNGNTIRKFKAGKSGVGALGVSSDGRYLVCASATMRVFDLSSGEKMFSLSGHANQIVDIAFVSTEKLFSAAQDDKFMACWGLSGESEETRDGEVIRPQSCASAKASIRSLACNGKIVIARLAGKLNLWNVTDELFQPSNKKPVKYNAEVVIPSNEILHAVAFTSESEIIICRGSSTRQPLFHRMKIQSEDGSLLSITAEERGVERVKDSSKVEDLSLKRKRSMAQAPEDVAEQESQDLKKSKNGSVVGEVAVHKTEYVGAVETIHGPLLKGKVVKMANQNEISKNAEALKQLSQGSLVSEQTESSETAAPSTSSVHRALSQALVSGDRKSIQALLNTMDQEVISKTIEHLDIKQIMVSNIFNSLNSNAKIFNLATARVYSIFV
jgi:hypothetical protein